jgi:polyphosphate kinase
VPPVVPRLIPVNKEGTKFALVEEVIEANIQSLFPSMTFSKGHLFRVTRDADVEIRDDKAADLLALIKESLRERRFGLAVRLEVSSSMPPEMVEYLTNSLKLEKDDVYVIDGLLDVQDLMELYSLDQPDLKDKPLKAIVPPALRNKESLFDA